MCAIYEISVFGIRSFFPLCFVENPEGSVMRLSNFSYSNRLSAISRASQVFVKKNYQFERECFVFRNINMGEGLMKKRI